MKAQEDRLTDAYLNEAIDLERYKAEMATLKQRREALERSAKELEGRQRHADEGRRAVEQIQAFCRRVAQGLDSLTFEELQQLLRLVVEGVTVEGAKVSVQTIIPITPVDAETVLLRNNHPERREGSLRAS